MKYAKKENFNHTQFMKRLFIDQIIQDWNMNYLAGHINKAEINRKFREIKELL